MTAESPPARPEPGLLETRGLTKRFEGVIALSNLDLSVRQGSIAGLIGPNGAGKTTLFNVATGFYPPDEGTITLAGKRLQGLRPHSITALGIARTFQNIRLFGTMTALENVLVGQHMHADFVARATPEEEDGEPARGFRISLGADHWAYRAAFPGRMLWEVLATLGRPGVVQETERVAVDRSQELLGFVGLKGRHNEIARSLPYGDQRRLELARALATRPKLLLLDEPTAGMNPQESQEIVQLIRSIRDKLGTTVLLIEHHMRVVMGVCEMITVLDYGEKIAEGPPEVVQRDKHVIEAYLGTGHTGIGNGAAGG
jgi:ABC-type branched-subunit amino acid transport system ATPase component